MTSYPKKLNIFVGGTRRDINKHREHVISAILSAGHLPSGMELWAADFTPTLNAIDSHLKLCDIHIVLLGPRYGSPIAPGKISFTEWEYNNSILHDRPVLAFVQDDEEFEKQIKEVVHQSAVEDEDRQRRLREFRKRVMSSRFVRRFSESTTQDMLERDCVNAINQAINSDSLPKDCGWIPLRSKQGKVLRGLEKNPFVQRILEKIYEFDKLTERVEKEDDAKKAMGRAFWELMIGRVKRTDHYSLFFESGSTIAYVADAFEEKIRATGGDRSEENRNWRITTNNSLTLLQFILSTNIETTPCPPGSPEGYYGAIFNSPLFRNPEAPPTTPRNLYAIEKTSIEETVKLISASNHNEGRLQLFLGTASGLDLDNKEEHFRGPHIGSHPNMLFKRAMFQTRKPIVLFFAEGKIGMPFEVNKCYPVFGPDLPWNDVLTSCPLAICVGYSVRSTRDEIPLVDRYGEGSTATLKPQDLQTQLNPADRVSLIQAKLAKSFGEGCMYPYATKFIPELGGGATVIANKKFMDVFPAE